MRLQLSAVLAGNFGGNKKKPMTEKKQATRDGFGQGIIQAAQTTQNLVVLCADLTESTRVLEFSKQFPKQYLEMGVSEENMVGVSAGLALENMIPVAVSYATFITTNALAPLRASVCYSNLNVKVVGCHSGLGTGEDGATHQALEDIATMRVLPNMTVIVPADAEETRKATLAMIAHKGPVYLRTGKHPTAPSTTPDTEFVIGKAVQLREGADVTLIACGTMVSVALEVSEQLKDENIHVRVINMHTIKPIDHQAIAKTAQETKVVITLEDHQKMGGLGSAVAEVLVELTAKPRFAAIGVEDTFGESGPGSDLLQKYGLDAEAIKVKIKTLLH